MATPVQTGTEQVANAATVTKNPAFASNLTVGNFLIVVIGLSGSVANPSPTVSSVNVGTDSLSLITGAAQSNGSGITGARCEIWGATIATSGQKALTVNTTTACNIEVAAAEYAASTYQFTVDATAGVVLNTGSGSGGSSGTIVPSANNELVIFGFVKQTNTATSSPTNSFVIEASAHLTGSGTGNCDANLIDLAQTTAASTSCSVTNSGAVNWASVTLAFKAAAASVTAAGRRLQSKKSVAKTAQRTKRAKSSRAPALLAVGVRRIAKKQKPAAVHRPKAGKSFRIGQALLVPARRIKTKPHRITPPHRPKLGRPLRDALMQSQVVVYPGRRWRKQPSLPITPKQSSPKVRTRMRTAFLPPIVNATDAIVIWRSRGGY